MRINDKWPWEGSIKLGITTVYFGGGGGSKVEAFDPFAGTGIRELYKQLSQWLGPQIGQPGPVYPGQRVPEVSSLQHQAFGAAAGLGPTAESLIGQGIPPESQQYLQQAGGTLQDMLAKFDPKAATEMWRQSFVNPSMRLWEEQIMPTLAEQGAGAKAGSGLNRALARGGAGFAENLSGSLGRLLYAGQQAQEQRRQAGIGQAMQLAGAPLSLQTQRGQVAGMGTDLMSQLMNIGTAQRGIGGEDIMAQWGKWQEGQPYSNPYLNLLPMALQQPGVMPVVEQQAPSWSQPLLGGLGSYMGQTGLGGLLGGGGLGGLFGGLFGGGATAGPLGGIGTFAGLGGGAGDLFTALSLAML